ncbi:MAG: alpha/beta hydrolase, partial [archaeon]|nr:alpha/beta hydrolase [archaeon]
MGKREDPVVLLIAGHSGTLAQWHGFDSQLAGSGLFVISFDNRDAGGSDKLNDVLAEPLGEIEKQRKGEEFASAYSVTDMVEDCRAVLDHFSAAEAHIVGQSMGGLIAQVFAVSYPQRTASLTVVMSAIPFWPALGRAAQKDGGALLAQLGALYATCPAPREDMSLAEFVECRMPFWKLLSDLSDGEASLRRIEQILAIDFHRRAVDWSGMGGFRQTLAINHWELHHLEQHMARLKGLTVPALVLHGVADPLIPFECGKELAE